ncbi:S41 family peptidase [Candidatus Parcubacteria bacterium]|nr:MAG: S41 family peptidase [Candidatus Parcubacteria bacterium]
MDNFDDFSNKLKTQRPLWKTVVFIIAIGGIFFAGFFTARNYFPERIVYTGIANKELGKPAEVDFSLFWNAFEAIENRYVDRDSLDYQMLVYGAVDGLVKALGDPYSNFFTPTSTKQFLEEVSGTFEGIGAEIDIRDGTLTIVAPLKGAPAADAGLRPGDQVIKINGQSTAGITLEEAVKKIRGPRGTTVNLTIRRVDDFSEDLEIQVKRAVINIPVAHYEFKEGVNHVQLFQFSETLPFEFRKIVFQILASGSDKIVLDLRNNPGGFLEASVDIASFFLAKDEPVVIEDLGNGEQNVFRSKGHSQLIDFKIVVLVNEGSASASEILAGALRDIRGIKLIGTKTFGKGSVQELVDLKEGTSLKLTIANWLTPNKNLISNKGLEPDISVELTNEDIEAGKDPQLEKALEIVKGL